MQNMPIGIFRGDDTDAFSYQTIVGTINTDLDLTECKAVFRYLDFSMEFDPIPEDKKLTIVIPADETKRFPPGLGYASLRVYDSEGRLKTFSNRIMVFVATKTPMFGSDEFEVDFNVRASLEPLKFFVGPNPDDFDEYRGYLEKVIDRASAGKYGLAILLDAIDSDLGAADGVAATPVAVKAAYAAIIDKLTDDYYTAEQTDEAIDRVAAYYITYDAAGNPFPTYAALANAQTVYSGGKVRTPTRNDYCVVLADETHDNAEYRYIYAVADGETTGSWQPQFPVEGVMTVDPTVTRNSQNPVSGGGIWSAIWGALSALPTGFTSLYDWCVAQLRGKRDLVIYNAYAPFWCGEHEQYLLFDAEYSIENECLFWGDIDILYVKYEFSGKWRIVDVEHDVDELQTGGSIDALTLVSTTYPSLTFVREFTSVAHDTLALTSQMNTALAGKASKADATLTERDFSAWVLADNVNNPITGEWLEQWQRWSPSATSGEVTIVNDRIYIGGVSATTDQDVSQDGLSLVFNGFGWADLGNALGISVGDTVATRTVLPGYQLGSQSDKPLASEAEAEALRQGKQSALSAQQLANIAAVSDALAFDATHSYAAGDPVVYNGTLYTFTATHTGAWTGSDVSAVDIIARLAGKLSITSTAPQFQDEDTVYQPGMLVVYNGALYVCTQQHYGAWNAEHFSAHGVVDSAISQRVDSKASKPNAYTVNHLASIDEFGNIADSGIAKANVAQKSDIPYSLGTPTIIDTAFSETVEGETVYYGEATLADHTANIVQVTAATALDELRITFPAATSGKVRDFGLRVEIGTGSAALAAPALVPIAPTGETIKIENADGTIPELADGTATAKGVTLLYFSETASGVFVVKGEQVEEVA